MKAKNIVKVNPPKRGILMAVSPALAEARVQRNWARYNRLTIADVLSQLHQLRLASAKLDSVREVRLGLFEIIEQARAVLLSLTGAPGIISQFELQSLNSELESCRGHWSDSVPPPCFAKVDELVARYRAGWLVDPGTWKLRPSKNQLICLSSYGPPHKGQFHNVQPIADDTPTPAQLQEWFDLPSDPPPAGSSPAVS